MASPFVHLTEKEVELLKRWQAEGKSVREIAGLLQRDETTIRRRMKSAIKVPKISLASNRAEDAGAMESGARGPCGPSVDRPVDRSVDRCIFIGFPPWTVNFKKKIKYFKFF